jgi:hypothetical protein
MYANAGLFGKSRTAHLTDRQRLQRANDGAFPEDFIERAQTKVEQWLVIGDTRAVRAGGVGEPTSDVM